jgi:hypothetical protein
VKLSRVEVGGLFGDLVFLDRYATWIATRTDTVTALASISITPRVLAALVQYSIAVHAGNCGRDLLTRLKM